MQSICPCCSSAAESCPSDECATGSSANLGGCAGIGGVVCDSLDCGLYFERLKVHRELSSAQGMLEGGTEQLAAALGVL